MCIGMYAGDASEDFKCLIGCREAAASSLGVPVDSLGLSMGMSADYILAIEMGATYVRPGSTIFGARTYANKK